MFSRHRYFVRFSDSWNGVHLKRKDIKNENKKTNIRDDVDYEDMQQSHQKGLRSALADMPRETPEQAIQTQPRDQQRTHVEGWSRKPLQCNQQQKNEGAGVVGITVCEQQLAAFEGTARGTQQLR